ncbi:MAG: hypothetical protein HOJ43_00710 [Betaproteobacteria bacterium]|nr:hypothetical protein [Betaproteobacteria bacterium]
MHYFDINNFEGCENVERAPGGVLDWGSLPTYTVWAKSKFTNEDVIAAFAGGLADVISIKLLKGFELCKVVSNTETLSRTGNMSPWWIPFNRLHVGGKHIDDPGWHMKVNLANRNGVHAREWARNALAIKENWGSLKFLCRVTLKTPVKAFFGRVAGQNRMDPVRLDDDTGKKINPLQRESDVEKSSGRNLPGNARQLYIPFTTNSDYQYKSDSSLTGGHLEL